jgi:hypothetical protein
LREPWLRFKAPGDFAILAIVLSATDWVLEVAPLVDTSRLGLRFCNLLFC